MPRKELGQPLSVLASLSTIASSDIAPDLAEPNFWRLTTSQWEFSLAKLLGETIVGFIDTRSDWKSWAGHRVPDPPP